MSDNQLERYLQGLKSLGKVFWISTAITLGSGIMADYVKKDNSKKILNATSLLGGIVSLGSIYKNRNKVFDCMNPTISNQEIKNKYGVDGNTYFLKFD